ncbi:MAG TPA: hypothetical protein VGL77_19280 [Armatimonadota bacterium]
MPDPNMLFDLQMKDAEIHDALHDFFQQAGRAFILDDELTETITVHAADVGFQDALKLLLPSGYTVMEIDDIYHIRKLDRAA